MVCATLYRAKFLQMNKMGYSLGLTKYTETPTSIQNTFLETYIKI